MNGRFLALLTLVVVVAALGTGHVLLLRVGYVLSAVLLVSAALAWSSVRWVDVKRHTRSARSEVGELAEETLTDRNRGWLPKLWLEIRDESDLPGHMASRVLSSLGPGQLRSWTARTRCRHRGVFTLGPLYLSGGDPLGMFRIERELPQTAPFVVYPRTVPLRGVDLPTGYLTGGQVVRRRAQFATTNVRGVRAYQPGDEFSRIHWPTTARRGRLHSKEFELDPIADFWLLLDLERDAHVGEPLDEVESHVHLDWMDDGGFELEPTTEEYAVTATASLARHFLDAGKSVGMIAYGQRRLVLQPDRGERQLAKVLTNLAVLRAAGRAGLAQVLSTEGHEFGRHTTLVIVTPTTTLRWIDGLRELRHRGVASMVVLLDASTFGTAGSSDGVRTALAANRVPTRVLACDQDIGAALSAPST
jgi:uncharacterized protein (DUF58 family)